MPRVLVVGAGMAGLTAARALERGGVPCVVVDKGRAVGGRMATCTIGEARFDHGAQHFSARSPEFVREVAGWEGAGVATVWFRSESWTSPERGVEDRRVGVGGMRRIPEHLAAGLDVRTGVTVTRLELSPGRAVALAGDEVVATAAGIVVTPPLPQTLALLAASGIRPGAAQAKLLGAVRYDACLAVMATLSSPSGLADGHEASRHGPVAWIADDQHRGTSPSPAVTIHSSPAFAAAHLDEAPERWVPLLRDAAAPHLAAPIVAACGHAWRYSMPRITLDTGCIAVDRGGVPLVLAGEVFAGAKVEGAFTSGIAAAEKMLSIL